jgi:alanyl-tRNA synthetase
VYALRFDAVPAVSVRSSPTERTSAVDTSRIIATFLDFYRDRGHRHLSGGCLLPPDGNTVLFTSAGMHPLTPYLEGKPHPLGVRLVGVQRCLRTTDLDEVGDDTHLTVFEMLGSWSLGDYDGEQSLRWGYELLTHRLGIDPEQLHATVFGGDDQIGPDLGCHRVWDELGVPVERTHAENWWSNGPTGPCGPDSEIFAWTGEGTPTGTPTTDGRWVEIWNHVMMRYRRLDDGSLQPLPRSNVDTGVGLERLAMVLQGKRSVFDIDVFRPWTRAVRGLWGMDGPQLRLVCDHLRSAVVVIGDGVQPSNTGRGYVLRRLIRRTLTTLWHDGEPRTLADLSPQLIEDTLTHFGQGGVQPVLSVLAEEERRFRALLERGRRVLMRWQVGKPLGDEDYRYLHDTHGLPRELVAFLLGELV